ncbi:MAG: tetratricopeptide repeat protein [Bacteroidales bacterium]|nr:tetratricopeptide repeat protein [Bacteroidales bacterium]
MRKLITLVIIALAFSSINAQEGASSVVLLNPTTVKKKVDKSDAEITDPKKSLKAATWLKRGDLYQDVFNIGLEQTQDGMDTQMLTLFYKKPNGIENKTLEDGSLQETYNYEGMKYVFVNGALQQWERVNPFCEDPLRIAIDAYVKTRELDDDGKLESKVKEGFISVKTLLKRQGVNAYYTDDYESALGSFEDVLEINELDLFAGEMDTVMIQYSGIISREIAGKTDNNDLYLKSIGYYKQLAAAGFGGPNTYLQIKMDYMNLGDTLSALGILQEAYTKYPDTVTIIANLANTYIELKQIDEGIAFMETVVENNPNIPESYYWLGRMYINKEEVEAIDKAIESYGKAAELDPSIYYVWYDMGYIYYLQGADFFERSNEETNDATREKLIELGKEKYQASIPILEKAYEFNNDNDEVKFETLDLLQRIYYKEEMTEQYERVKELKNNM